MSGCAFSKNSRKVVRGLFCILVMIGFFRFGAYSKEMILAVESFWAVEFTFQSEIGRDYRIQYSDGKGGWADSESLISGSGESAAAFLSRTNFNAVDYRIQELPAGAFVPFQLRPALRIDFDSRGDVWYQIQSSMDMSDWNVLGEPFQGEPDHMTRYLSTQSQPMEFIRILILPGD